jgi:hypothetical protein
MTKHLQAMCFLQSSVCILKRILRSDTARISQSLPPEWNSVSEILVILLRAPVASYSAAQPSDTSNLLALCGWLSKHLVNAR